MEARGPPNNDLEKAKLLYNKTIELEKQLRNELKKKNPLDRSIALLRNNIRDNFEQVLFLNYEFAISKDVEQAIWKSVFYRVIEEFRKRLRKSPQQQTDEQEQKRMGASFKQFLTSALNFYQRLLCKLQATFHLTLDGSVAYRIQDDNGLVKLHRSYLSCHRCFIFMGDLARYHKDIKDDENDKSPPVWMRAAQYYQRALMIFPDNGNPHNQLAVLATYEDDAFSGVYRYFRSLAIRQPFVTARDNLKVLFDKNRSKLESEEGFGDDMSLFLARFVQLHGIYFHKADLEQIAPLKETLLQSFATFLANVNSTLTVPIILKMIAMLIFTVHNVVLPRSATEQQPPQPSQQPQQQIQQQIPKTREEDFSQLQSLAIIDAFDFVAVLLRAIHALCAHKLDATRCAEYLGCVCVFSEWLRMHPEFVSRGNSLVPGNMWDALAQLFNSLATLNLDTSKSVPAFLSAEAELRGFLPLHNYIKTLPQSSLVIFDPNSATQDPNQNLTTNNTNQERKTTDADAWSVLSFRVRKLREFGAFACGLHPQVIFHNKDTGLYSSLHYKPNSLSIAGSRVRTPLSPLSPLSPPALLAPPSQPHYDDNSSMKDESDDDDDEASFPPTKFEFVDEDDDADIVESAFNNHIVQDDDFEDEVILYKPDQTSFHLASLSHIRSNSTSPSSSSSPSPALSPSLSSAIHHVLNDGNANGAVQVRGAEFGIIGSRPKTPPQDITATATSNGTTHPSPKSATSPSPQMEPQSSFYSNFDFSSYYGLNHPFTLSEPSAPATPSSPSPSPSPSLTNAQALSYSLFSANTSSPLPQVIDMPFQSSNGTSQAQSESDEHSPTCTNKGPFAWLSPVPLTLANSSPSLGPSDISMTPASFLDSAILSTGVSLPFPFPGEPTLKFRTKNPYINT